ncbi:MAG: PQQ-like beta-propeller repeat protein [Candidatus Cloacimonetes bacterium]|nr:PQQ-like beta-propeller repeat protein [Candidatus Cloacimonadota bacterium]
MAEYRGNQLRNLNYNVKNLPQAGASWTHICGHGNATKHFLVDEGVLYFCDGDRNSDTNSSCFRAIDVHTQKEIWRQNVPPVYPEIPFSLCSSSIVQGCYNGKIVCISRHTGNIQWQRNFEGFEVRYSVIVLDSLVVCIMHKVGKPPQLVCLHIDSGETFWIYKSRPPKYFGNGYSHLLHESGIIVYSAGTALYGVSLLRGEEVFFHDDSNHIRTFPVMDGKHVIYGEGKQIVYFSLNSLTVVRFYEFSEYLRQKGAVDEVFILAGDLVFWGSYPGLFHVYDQKLEKSLLLKNISMPFSVNGNEIFFGSGGLYKMSLADFKFESYSSPEAPSKFKHIIPTVYDYTPPLLSDEGIFLKENGGIYGYGLKRVK